MKNSRLPGRLSRFLLLFLLYYGCGLALWSVLLPNYARAQAKLCEWLLPVIEHPRLTTSLRLVEPGAEPQPDQKGATVLAVFSRALNSDAAIYSINVTNAFANYPAVVAMLLALPQLRGRRSRVLLRGMFYLALAHLAFLHVQLYHLYAIQVRETREILFGPIFRFLIRGAHILLFAVGTEAIVGLVAILAVVGPFVLPDVGPSPPARRALMESSARRLVGRLPRLGLPPDVVAVSVLLLTTCLAGSLFDGRPAQVFSDALASGRARSATSLFKAGRELLMAGDAAGAHDAFTRVLAIESNHVAAHLQLAGMAVKAQDLPEAMAHLQSVVEVDPANAAAVGDLGAVEARLGRRAEAAMHLRTSLKLDPALVTARVNLAYLLLADDRVTDARLVLEAAPLGSGQDARLQMLRGHIQWREGDACGARQVLAAAALSGTGLQSADRLRIERDLSTLADACALDSQAPSGP